jgi:SpoVK/Ycf46/Vps4 family AAA+-type ATPase
MGADDPVLPSLLSAVAASPADLPLRLHVARVLLEHGRAVQALEHCSVVLAAEPANPAGLRLLREATAALSEPAESLPAEPAESLPAEPAEGIDWRAYEEQVSDIMEPAFLGEVGDGSGPEDLTSPTVRLSDVGGMEAVKQRLQAAFLGPMSNPALARQYGKTLSGGLLLYGPPGCGKTFIARAVAGELGARFYAVSLADVLDTFIGQSEKNLAAVFDTARRNAPCVLFLDEMDALGQKRIHLRHNSAMRGTVNQLLGEMDSAVHRNDGVFVLGATNHPWDVDSALRRPGRFDRMLLVLPPDPPARQAILHYHLRDRPVAGIGLAKLAGRTEGYSGADLAHLCDTAAESALADALRTGAVRPIGMPDLERALAEVKPSTSAWFETARNVAQFANEGGAYDDLLAYLKSRRML